jgi:hypothetical protein
MKYIRTKDGHIFPLQIKTSEEYMYQERGEFYSSKIIAQADTIDELCDFNNIEIISNVENIIFSLYGTFLRLPPNPNIKSGRYSAILTDKGLIYVAKMNEKGELELL